MSYVEMLVAITIVTIVLLVAGAMLVQLSRQAEQQASRAPVVGGMTDLALDQLEKDLREATSVDLAGGAAVTTLSIDTVSGDKIKWTAEGSDVSRARVPAKGPATNRVVARDVAVSDWQRRSTHLFDIEMRRKNESVRQRTVLLRNVDREPPREEEAP
jgi:type II secretory pathway pseudopilin PulG